MVNFIAAGGKYYFKVTNVGYFDIGDLWALKEARKIIIAQLNTDGELIEVLSAPRLCTDRATAEGLLAKIDNILHD